MSDIFSNPLEIETGAAPVFSVIWLHGLGADCNDFKDLPNMLDLPSGLPVRFILPNARTMIHQPSGGAQGQATDIEIQAKEILFLRERLNSLLADHTGQTIDVIERDTERDRFMSAEQSVEYGLVDEVISSR